MDPNIAPEPFGCGGFGLFTKGDKLMMQIIVSAIFGMAMFVGFCGAWEAVRRVWKWLTEEDIEL